MVFSFSSQRLKPLGRLEKTTKMGLTLVSMFRKKPLPLGLSVYIKDDDRVKYVGKLIDVIGSVERPYAVVKLEEDVEISAQTLLYYELERKRKAQRSRRSRSSER